MPGKTTGNPGFYPWAYNFGQAIDYRQKTINHQQAGWLRKQIKRAPKQSKVLLYHPLEYTDPAAIFALAAYLQDQHDRITWLMHANDGVDALPGHSVEFFNYDWLNLHLEHAVYGTPTWRHQWQYTDASHFLIMVGKPYQGARLKLIYQLYRDQLLDAARYSLNIDPVIYQRCRQCLPMISDQDFDDFVRQSVRHLDRTSFSRVHLGSPTWYNNAPYRYPRDVYQDIPFQIVLESSSPVDEATITEKTWFCMANRTPFLILSQPGALDKLRRQGFRTFESYLRHPDYNQHAGDKGLELLVENVHDLVNNIDHYREQIEQDVDHNFELLGKSVSEHWHRWQQLSHHMADTDPVRLIPLQPERAAWINWYWTIRARDWPDCVCREHFARLPDHIKQEIEHRFGLPEF